MYSFSSLSASRKAGSQNSFNEDPPMFDLRSIPEEDSPAHPQNSHRPAKLTPTAPQQPQFTGLAFRPASSRQSPKKSSLHRRSSLAATDGTDLYQMIVNKSRNKKSYIKNSHVKKSRPEAAHNSHIKQAQFVKTFKNPEAPRVPRCPVSISRKRARRKKKFVAEQKLRNPYLPYHGAQRQADSIGGLPVFYDARVKEMGYDGMSGDVEVVDAEARREQLWVTSQGVVGVGLERLAVENLPPLEQRVWTPRIKELLLEGLVIGRGSKTGECGDNVLTRDLNVEIDRVEKMRGQLVIGR